VTVYDYVAVSFTGLDAEYCENDLPVTLSGSELPQGVFGGPGIIDNSDGTATFNPSNATAGGPYTITYIYTEVGGCMNEYSQQVTVNPVTEVSFTGLQASYCDQNTNYLISGSEPADSYFMGIGISNNDDGTAFFNPSIPGVGGPYTISYFYQN
jgi:hypothetical protein